MGRGIAGAVLALGVAGAAGAAQAPRPADDFRVVVVSESGDVITWLRPEGNRRVVDRVVPVGIMPADIDGPHHVAMAPDMKSYFVTLAHGVPFGTLWRFDAANDTVMGRATVELFPTTIAVTPDGEIAFVANSDFHGERPRTNVVSVVHLPTMVKLTDIPACDMPHGVRVNHAGTLAYVSCMNSDELLELDTATFEIRRRIAIGSGHSMGAEAGGDHHPVASTPPGGADRPCAGTFVSVSADDARLYLACNAGNTVQVRNAADLALVAEIPVGAGAYNVEPSPDGRFVVATNKKDQSVSIIDPAALREIARVRTTKKIVHGVAFSPDGRLAYVSQESVGSDPGAVDVIDLAQRKVVGTVPVPAQPTGIAVARP
ncbi:MAG: YncE family protein [Gemmatimonadales bacterium]